MISKEEIEKAKEVMDNLIAIFKNSIFESVEIYSPDNYKKALENAKNLIEKQENRIKELEIEKDYYKARYLEFNNAFIEGGRKLTKEEITGKAIQEMGTSDLYRED